MAFCKKSRVWKESSILLSDNKQISVPLRATSLKPENLFLIELILRCPIITFLGWFRRCSCRLFNVSQSVSEDTVSTDSYFVYYKSYDYRF